MDSHSGTTKRDNVFFACDAFKELSRLCRESISLPSIEELIASLLTIRLCSISAPTADVIIPLQTEGLDAGPISERVARFLSSKVSKGLKIHPFTWTDKGYLLKEKVALSQRATFLIKDVCVLSFYPLRPDLYDECYSLLMAKGAKSVYFLSFVSEGEV